MVFGQYSHKKQTVSIFSIISLQILLVSRIIIGIFAGET